jgi:hypothetical protein
MRNEQDKPSGGPSAAVEFISSHFALVSAISVLIASGLTLDFIVSYLVSFDWNLIWIIEYQDLAKFIIIGSALLLSIGSSFIYFFEKVVETFRTGKSRISLVILISIFIAVLGWEIYSARNNQGLQYYYVTLTSAFVIGLLLIHTAVTRMRMWLGGNMRAIAFDAVSFVVMAALLGTTLAARVKFAESKLYNVETESRAYRQASIVMLLSHHIIIYVNDKVVVLPTPSVTRMVSEERDSQISDPDTR